MLSNALIYGAAKVTLLALWNAELPSDGTGGAQDMMKIAEERGVKIIRLDATPLARLAPGS